MRRSPDVPLAPLIGIPAKRTTEPGAPSLKHPVARVFSAIVATSPLASLKWCNADHSHREKQILARLMLPRSSWSRFDHALIYTNACTLAFQNWLISVTFSNVRSQGVSRARISAVIEGSLVPLKMLRLLEVTRQSVFIIAHRYNYFEYFRRLFWLDAPNYVKIEVGRG